MLKTVLSADIGGTNTRFELYVVYPHENLELIHGKIAPGTLLADKIYQNEEFSTFHDVVRTFFDEFKIEDPPTSACFAVAGPVSNNEVLLTNREGWRISGRDIETTFGIKTCQLINDFVAVGYGLITLDESKDCITLQDAPKTPGAPMACVGAGTGLGECFLAPGDNGEYVCYPTEGGHAEFAPRDELERKLLLHLLHKFESKHRVSVERVVSGIGLWNVYEFMALEMPDKVDPEITAQLNSAGDQKGRVIATNQQNYLCHLTMQVFAGAYGCEVGVAALKYLPQHGLYVGGGLTPKNIDLLKDPDGPFLRAFRDKGRVSGILKTIPVYAVMRDDVGRRGAHWVAIKQLVNMSRTTMAKKDTVSTSQKQSVSIQSSVDFGNVLTCFFVSLAMFGVGYLRK